MIYEYWVSDKIRRSIRNFQRRVTRREMSMLVKLHTKNFANDRGIFGMYANLKPLPKPPKFRSASRDLRLSWQKKSFQVAYHGTSFYTQGISDKNSFGKIVTRLHSWNLAVPPGPNVWSAYRYLHVKGRHVEFFIFEVSWFSGWAGRFPYSLKKFKAF